jgi:hypothetical protein
MGSAVARLGLTSLGIFSRSTGDDFIRIALIDEVLRRCVTPCVCRKHRPFDLMTESLNVGRDGRADISVLELGCLALQAQKPA